MPIDNSQQPGLINRLIASVLPGPQNFLTNPQAALSQNNQAQPHAEPESYQNVPGSLSPRSPDQHPDPWAGMRQPTGNPTSQQSGSGSGFIDKWKDFDKSDTGRWLGNMFQGWAQGNSVSDSLAKGGLSVAQGGRENQTIKYLTNNGYSQEDAQAINGNHDALNLALSNIFRKQDPSYALQTQQAQANLDKTQAETRQLNAKPTTKYGFSTLPDGTMVRTNEAAGSVEPIYNPWGQGGTSGRGAPGTPLSADERAQFGISDTDKTPYIHNEKGLPAPLSPSLVNLSNAGETAEEKALGEARAKNIIGYMDAGQDGRKELQSLNLIEDAFNAGNGNIATGPGADSVVKAKSIMQNLGYDVKSLAPSELVGKLGTQFASTAASGMTSRPTQFDFQTFLKNNPGLALSEKGNRAMIDIYKQQAQQKIDLAHMAQSYKGHTADWNDVVAQYDKEHPIISPFTHKPLGANERVDGMDEKAPAPQGVDPSIWGVMTPEEKALWTK
ncbi:hypothetical protein [Ochrobactrum sp. AN78]|uniref:hypothetical protein n=1 Tax=Ochrobactrum sp. AN78 TaxID=3039853 RepID=UPI002989DA60|nr:hypothetical protein [Ochrobactrum sp. AN78]MDH7790731.1 hypothetical protein [Ochrobactrum sp. AN78]